MHTCAPVRERTGESGGSGGGGIRVAVQEAFGCGKPTRREAEQAADPDARGQQVCPVENDSDEAIGAAGGVARQRDREQQGRRRHAHREM